MRRPRLTAAMALATATIVTVAGCSTQIGGTASPAITGGATTSSSSTGSHRTRRPPRRVRIEQQQQQRVDLVGGTEFGQQRAGDHRAEHDVAVDQRRHPDRYPDGSAHRFPDLQPGLPAGWPAELQLPAGATIITSTESGGEMSVTFQGTGTGADLMAALDANAVAAGSTQTSADAASGAYTASYSKSGSTLEISLLEYGGTAFGSLVISPA